MKDSFNRCWEEKIYSQGKQLNLYPFDILVSLVARNFFSVPRESRVKIKILDVGCGAGNNAKFLAENGFCVYGIDGSSSAVEICNQRFKKWNLAGNFTQGDFLELPYENGFFDMIFDRESIYANKRDHVQKIIMQIHEKLKPGGIFVSFMYSSHHPDKEFGEIIEPNTYGNFRKGSCFYEAGVVHFVDIKEIISFYSRFNIENIARHSLLEVYNKPGRFMEFDEYIIIARK